MLKNIWKLSLEASRILDEAVCYPVNTFVGYFWFSKIGFLQVVTFESAMQYNYLKGKHFNHNVESGK